MYLSGMNCHYRYYDLEFCFKKLSETGFQKMELWTGPMHFYVDYRTNEDPGKLQLLSKKYGIDIIAVCPEQTNPKPNNIASASRQDDIFNYYQRIIDIAEKCKSKKVTVTSGWAYRNENFEQAYERSVQMIRRIARYAAEKGINLVMEALQPEESILVNSSKDLKKYIDRVGEHNLKVCIDFGAMAKMGETIDDYFENCGSLIEHIHFVDGKPTGHLAYPDGDRDIVADLQALQQHGYQGYLSCESVAGIYYEKPWIADEKNYKAFLKGKEELEKSRGFIIC